MGNNLLQPIYTTFESVKLRLVNKVQFQSDKTGSIEGELPDSLLAQLIVDAETEVEQDLRSRYSIPFQSKTKGTFVALPDHSKRALRVACDYMAVINILMTDFGRGTHIAGEAYTTEQQKKYEEYINKLLGRDAEGRNDKIDRFRHSPPLDDVLLALSNSMADDGFRGTLINTDGSRHDAPTYAGEQINNPAATYINRRVGPRLIE